MLHLQECLFEIAAARGATTSHIAMVISMAILYPMVSRPRSGAIIPQKTIRSQELKKKPPAAAGIEKKPILYLLCFIRIYYTYCDILRDRYTDASSPQQNTNISSGKIIEAVNKSNERVMRFELTTLCLGSIKDTSPS